MNLNAGNRLDLRLTRLSIVTERLSKIGLKVFVIDGALLGLVRDDSIIEWDWDAEIAIVGTEDAKFKVVQVVEELIALHGFRINSATQNRYFKFNLVHKDDLEFTFCIFNLRQAGRFLVRPRFKYPIEVFGLDLMPVICRFQQIEIPVPTNREALLNHTYGESWNIPFNPEVNPNYLSRDVYRWKALDLLYVILSKFRKLLQILRKFLFSELILGREPIFQQLLRFGFDEGSILIEIGSSDGIESKTFLKYHDSKSQSIIFEPSIPPNKHPITVCRSPLLTERAFLLQSLVVANKADSINFEELPLGHLSRINTSLQKEIYTQSSKETEFSVICFEKVVDLFEKRPMIIKMDIEGYEVEILRKFVELDSKAKSVAFLIELHQERYQMSEIISTFSRLFELGYIIEYVETATSPSSLAKSRLRTGAPIINNGKRALLRTKIDKVHDIEDLFLPRFCYNRITGEVGNRLVRSIFVCKGLKVKPEVLQGQRILTKFWNRI